MPNYQTPFGRGGAALGATAGGGFMQGLGKLLEPLDYPRQALWNLPGKLADGDFLGALPGLLGALGGGALALSGVGLPGAILGGSLLGGAGQGVGKAADEERFHAPSGEDVTGDPVSGFLLQALGDPLTYAGGFKGRQVGRDYGKGLEDVALSRGPNYGGSAEVLNPPHGYNFKDPGQYRQYQQRVRDLTSDPNAARILGEIPEGSQLSGMGVEAMAFKTPQGNVVRVGGGPHAYDLMRRDLEGLGTTGNLTAPAPRPDLPEMLQPARSAAYGPYRVEHLPQAEMLPRGVSNADPMALEYHEAQKALIDQLEAPGRGLIATPPKTIEEAPFRGDLHLSNLGKTPAGRYAVVDPGAVKNAAPGSVGVVPDVQGTGFQNWLLKMLGSDQTVRREIEAELAKGGGTRGLLPAQIPGLADVPHPPPSPLPPRGGPGPAAPLQPVPQGATVNLRGPRPASPSGVNLADIAPHGGANPVGQMMGNSEFDQLVSQHPSQFASRSAVQMAEPSGVNLANLPGSESSGINASSVDRHLAEMDRILNSNSGVDLAALEQQAMLQHSPGNFSLTEGRSPAGFLRQGAPSQEMTASELQRMLLGDLAGPAQIPTAEQVNNLLRNQLNNRAMDTMLRGPERLRSSPLFGVHTMLPRDMIPTVSELADFLRTPRTESSFTRRMILGE